MRCGVWIRATRCAAREEFKLRERPASRQPSIAIELRQRPQWMSAMCRKIKVSLSLLGTKTPLRRCSIPLRHIMETVIECRVCAQFKPAIEFARGRRQCRACQSLKRRERRLRHRNVDRAQLVQGLLQDVQRAGQSLRHAALIDSLIREFGSPGALAHQIVASIDQCQTTGRHATAAKLLLGLVNCLLRSAGCWSE